MNFNDIRDFNGGEITLLLLGSQEEGRDFKKYFTFTLLKFKNQNIISRIILVIILVMF